MSNSIKTSFFLFPLFLFMFIAFFPADLNAQGNLLVTPRRVIFEGGKKTQELNLANTGRDTARYIISIKEIRMKEDGSFEEITQPDSGQHFASAYIRFFPRSVTLAPNEAQLVKMQLRNSSHLNPGEYRSHLYFRAVPEEKPLGESTTKKDSSAISVQLVPVFGITLPVIIRVGEATAEASLTDLSVEIKDNIPRLFMRFNRIGNMSLYGDVKVEFISPANKISEVAMVKGVAVYTPNLTRKFHVDLDKKQGIDYSKGRLRVSYTMTTGSKSVKIAETEIQLNL